MHAFGSPMDTYVINVADVPPQPHTPRDSSALQHATSHTTHNKTQQDTTHTHTTQHNTTQHNTTQRNATQRNATQRNATQRNATTTTTTRRDRETHNVPVSGLLPSLEVAAVSQVQCEKLVTKSDHDTTEGGKEVCCGVVRVVLCLLCVTWCVCLPVVACVRCVSR